MKNLIFLLSLLPLALSQTTTTSSPAPSPTLFGPCGGFRIPNPPTCASDEKCVKDPNGGCPKACDSPGICVKRCGGKRGLVCPKGSVCEDDLDDTCDPESGGADCIGNCMPPPAIPSRITVKPTPVPTGKVCGGLKGLKCDSGCVCQGCFPAGAADCSGRCVCAILEG